MKLYCFVLAFCLVVTSWAYVDYSGHKVLTVVLKSESDLELLVKLRNDYSVDLWNEPKHVGSTVMIRLRPELIEPVEKLFNEKNIEYDVAFYNLQSAIESERVGLADAPTNFTLGHANAYDLGKYNEYESIVQFLRELSDQNSDIAKLEEVGKTYENRPIYSMRIGAGSTKPAVMIECGIHAREWSSVAAGVYIVNKLITEYKSNPEVKALVDKYEFNIVVEANPDGYIYTWKRDRLWRKTRSRSTMDWLGTCLGVDANRNFDVEHCGVGTSRKPCEEIFCGDRPFSESESRALRDMMIALKDRMAIYFSIHAFSQLWMTPYGTTKKLPPNYSELVRIGQAGVNGLAKKYGTRYRLGSIANIIYEAAGSSLDYAYVKQGIKIGYALELRDNGRYGFILPQKDILPMCEETFDGVKAAIDAL